MRRSPGGLVAAVRDARRLQGAARMPRPATTGKFKDARRVPLPPPSPGDRVGRELAARDEAAGLERWRVAIGLVATCAGAAALGALLA